MHTRTNTHTQRESTESTQHLTLQRNLVRQLDFHGDPEDLKRCRRAYHNLQRNPTPRHFKPLVRVVQ